MAILSWDLDHWHWVEGYCFLNNTTKFDRDPIINRTLGTTHAANKWQGYLPKNYKCYWSQVSELLWSRKEVVFMWSILLMSTNLSLLLPKLGSSLATCPRLFYPPLVSNTPFLFQGVIIPLNFLFDCMQSTRVGFPRDILNQFKFRVGPL